MYLASKYFIIYYLLLLLLTKLTTTTTTITNINQPTNEDYSCNIKNTMIMKRIERVYESYSEFWWKKKKRKISFSFNFISVQPTLFRFRLVRNSLYITVMVGENRVVWETKGGIKNIRAHVCFSYVVSMWACKTTRNCLTSDWRLNLYSKRPMIIK